MPDIIVREYDNTTAGVDQYNNFSVLVAGPTKTPNAECFDENGVYEVSSAKDFEDNVGLCPAIEYTLHGSSPAVPAVPCVAAATTDEAVNPAKIYYTREATGEDAGELVDTAGYRYTPVETPTTEGLPTYYEVSERGSDAEPAVEGAKAIGYGNQIAYMLLTLGYTVLYLKIDDGEGDKFEKGATWEALKDKSIYDFRYITHGLVGETNSTNEAIAKLAEFINSQPDNTGRGDCVALCEIPLEDYEEVPQATAIDNIRKDINANAYATKYEAFFAPYIVYSLDAKKDPWNKFYPKDYQHTVGLLPATFHYLACAAKAYEQFPEWYATAGYTRGVCDYNISYTGCTFGEIAAKALQPRFKKLTNGIKCAVNLIIKIKDNYYIWGNRTGEPLGTEGDDNADLRASHFLNIRQLCTTIKKQVYITCKQYMYDPNSDILWARFCNSIRPTLERMKADQGITDYKFIKIRTNKKALLKAKIRIVPIEAVEDFDISLTLEDSISGIVAGVDEADAE